MNKVTISLLVGAAFAFLGVLLALKASSLATNWQMIGPDAWGGTTDPGAKQTYQFLGMLFAAFGLGVVALSISRWLRESDGLVRR